MITLDKIETVAQKYQDGLKPSSAVRRGKWDTNLRIYTQGVDCQWYIGSSSNPFIIEPEVDSVSSIFMWEAAIWKGEGISPTVATHSLFSCSGIGLKLENPTFESTGILLAHLPALTEKSLRALLEIIEIGNFKISEAAVSVNNPSKETFLKGVLGASNFVSDIRSSDTGAMVCRSDGVAFLQKAHQQGAKYQVTSVHPW